MTAIPDLGFQNNHTWGEWRLLIIIFGVLVSLILIPLLIWRHHETHRPSLAEIRIVSATSADPIFREGPRTVGPEEQVMLAVALRLEYPGHGSRWLAPVENLELEGAAIDHLQTQTWPEQDRTARTFWFTLESPFLGGILQAKASEEKLKLRPFLAPELGFAFLARGEPETHADDGINLGDSLLPITAGTYRMYARVEVVADNGSSRPLFSASSLGSQDIGNPAMVRISRDLEATFTGINPAAGHLFRLPGFESASDSDWDPNSACDNLTATSSRTFASMAATGHCNEAVPGPAASRNVTLEDTTLEPQLRWQVVIRPGDVLKQGNHWVILISDDGNGILDGPDLVAHCWRRPPAILPLAAALDRSPAQLTVLATTGQ